MIHTPRNFIALVLFGTTALFALIALGITGSLCSSGFCIHGGIYGDNTSAAGPAIGIVAAVFGFLVAGLGICWLIFDALESVTFTRYIILGVCGFVALFSFISGVILAYTAHNYLFGEVFHHTFGAASAFEFFLFLSVVATGVYLFIAKEKVPGSTPPEPAPEPSAPGFI